jgi:translation initiation factor IF-2
MSEVKTYRLGQAARNFGVTTTMISEFMAKKGHKVDNNPNTKITAEEYAMAEKEFAASAAVKKEASNISIGKSVGENFVISSENQPSKKHDEDDDDFVTIKTNVFTTARKEEVKVVDKKEPESISSRPTGLKVVGKIDINPPAKSPVETKVATEKKMVETPLAEPVKTVPVAEVKAPVAELPATVQAPQPPKVVVQAPPPTPPVVEKPTPLVTQTPVAPKAEPVVAKTPVVAPPVAKPEVVAEVKTPVEGGEPPVEVIRAEAEKLQGLKVLGKIELPLDTGRKKTGGGPGGKPLTPNDDKNGKRKRKRIKNAASGATVINDPNQKNGGQQVGSSQQGGNNQQRNNNPNNNNNQRGGNPNNNRQQPNNRGGQYRGPQPPSKGEITDKDIQDAIKNTLARLSGGKGQKTAVKKQIRRDKRQAINAKMEADMLREQADAKVLRVTEFISASELANLMSVPVNTVIAKCLSFGMFVSINQRLDAEAITIITDEFGYQVEFISAEEEVAASLAEQDDDPQDLQPRGPIVTIMGHVDHGKTSLLDFIRNANVVKGEAGGITQHIGAYDVTTKSGKRIAFLDTPGHEAFTAMRARGAKLTDVAIIVVAADDDVMPQTVEAINHAQVAGVPMVFAINKVDKADSKPEKIKESLSKINILVEDWGGKYQSQEISAKKGMGIDELLEKVLLEAELLELKANPEKNATGAVIEALLDKGKGYVTTVMVQGGTLRKGDIILAGAHYGRVKALMDHRGQMVKEAGPATPVQVLGLNGAPQAGDKFNVVDNERDARQVAEERERLLREQGIRATKRTTLSDIGRRIALGNFKQLNIVVKGDVDGSVEALSDSLLRLSTEEVEVNIIHKGVGQITESDVTLAAASDAVLIGFQVRPSAKAREMAEREQVEIRMYSIIYDAINEVKDAMEGLLAPTVEEHILGNAEVREVFRIAKVGTVAGCYITSGVIKRNARVRVVRDGIVAFGDKGGAEVMALKRFKEDASEVKNGYECGISIKGFNDIHLGDVIEAFEEREIKRKL